MLSLRRRPLDVRLPAPSGQVAQPHIVRDREVTIEPEASGFPSLQRANARSCPRARGLCRIRASRPFVCALSVAPLSVRPSYSQHRQESCLHCRRRDRAFSGSPHSLANLIRRREEYAQTDFETPGAFAHMLRPLSSSLLTCCFPFSFCIRNGGTCDASEFQKGAPFRGLANGVARRNQPSGYYRQT